MKISIPQNYLPLVLFTVWSLSGSGLLAQASNGSFAIIPSGTPEMALEAVGSGVNDGTVVSIGVPSATANQKWNLIPKGENLYVVRPSYSTTLALAAAGAGTTNGTGIILETESGKPSQLWFLKRNDNGTVGILPKHAPKMSLDNFGGKKEVGAKIDLWEYYNPNDSHLQWTLKPLDGPKNPFDKPEQKITGNPVPTNIPMGEIKSFTFNTSAIYPGTKRGVIVFIPAQYDGSKPACVYVQQDGYKGKEKAVLEELIAAKDIPVTIGVFVQFGQLSAPTADVAARRNRCFEYDSVGDNYVRFITEEILPAVEKTFNLKLSKSGNDRSIGGFSSGGIAAFNAAWERPDAFSRVYACSGSFVAFRGGHEFPTLIRKFEAKPIRAYLTTATQDMENCAGDWFLLDQEFDKALKFSGYDYQFHIIDGRHCAGGNESFPDAMRFLWKGWPEAVTTGTSAPRVRDVIIDKQNWEIAAQGYGDVRGAACNSKGEVFFVDTKNNKIYRIGLDGKAFVFLADAAQANSLSVGPKDEIYTVSSSTGNVMCYDSAGKGHVYASGINGVYVLAKPEGGVYVTGAENKPGEGSKIWFVKDGQKVLTASDIKRATGLAIRPDHWLLSVADGNSKWVHSYQMQPDGTLTNKERFFWLHVADWEDDAGAESVCYAKEGQMLVATRLGIQICADDGPTQVVLPMPDRSRVTGVCLGGPEMSTLFAFCSDKVWKRAVKIHAAGAFSPATKVAATPL